MVNILVPTILAGPPTAVIGMVLADLALILAAAFLFARLAAAVQQPAVMGEIIAGLALGPSLLGMLPGNPTAVLFPLEARPYLEVLSQLGLVLFVFGLGYQLDVSHLERLGGLVTSVSLSSVAVPFSLGSGLAMLLWPWFDQPQLKTKGVLGPALFLGAAMSITAFPVLARIVVECGMKKSRLGTTAIACAAIQDFLAWCILALVVAMVTTSGPWPLARITIESAAFILGLIYLVRPGLAWLLAPERRWAGNGLTVHTVLICGLLACAWATDAIGLHTVFGAFAFGTAVPRMHIDALVPQVHERIDQTSLLLLPVFFTVTGLSVDLGGLGGRGMLMVATVIMVACVGKFVGAAGAAKLSGQTGREAATLAILLNARGLTELIILDIGLGLGVLDQRLYTAMVVMAIVTTLMTGPLVRRMHREPAPPQITERQLRITHDEEMPR